MLTPTACRYEHFVEPWYAAWTERLNFPLEVSPGNPQGYRKNWEYAAILEALDNRGMLVAGKRGLGFAVGREPLPSVMAGRGVTILATDLAADKVDAGWISTSQHASSLEALYHSNLIDHATFEQFVSFRPTDMNDLSELPDNHWDFLWSSCAFEHLGTLQRGLDFVANAMRLLKPGGIAVHTTEYNVASNDETIEEGPSCIYRRRDLEELDRRLRRQQCGLEPMDFEPGNHKFDLQYDIPPYFRPGRVHIKLELDGHICTSFLLIAHKGGVTLANSAGGLMLG